MKLFGKRVAGGTAFELVADTKRVARYALPVAGNLAKLSAYADGLGSGSGNAVLRGVVYDTTGALLATGDEVVVRDGQVGSWIDLPFSAYPGGVPLVAASYDLGVLADGATNTIRVYGDASVGAGQTNADTYADGASNPFGASTVLDFDLSVFATYVTSWVSADRPEEEIAHLPWAESQAIFGATGTVISTLLPGSLGWYGSSFDDDLGAFALAGEGGPFESLVGQRIAITYGPRAAYVYVRDAAVLNDGEDLAVPLRVYAALDLLTQVPIEVEVEALA